MLRDNEICSSRSVRFNGVLSPLIGASLSCVLFAQASDAQSVDLRVLIPRSANFWANSLPSLHDGYYTGLGVRISDFRQVVYGGQLSDAAVPPGGVPRIVIETGESCPNNPGQPFAYFRIPTVWNGRAYFTGGATGTPVNDGLYARDITGGPVHVVSDRRNGNGPWIEGPFAGAEGIAYINQGVTAGTGAGFSVYTYGQQRIAVGTYFQPMPDGSVLQSTNTSRVSIGGGKVVYSVRVNFAQSGGQGVYVYDLETGQTGLIANSTMSIPGDGRSMESFSTVDTDGTRVVFAAGNGNLYFGGIAAVCLADADGSNVRVIARTGDPYPGVPGQRLFNVGTPSVDGPYVYFQGTYRDGTIERVGLFVHVAGSILPIVTHLTTVGGASGHFAWYDPRGVDGPDLVFELERPTANMGVSEYTLVHAHVNAIMPCTADFNADTVVDFFDYLDFVSVFASGSASADFNADTVVDFFDYLDFVAAFSAGC